MIAPSRPALATAAVLLAALFASSAGVLIRAIEAADGWQILTWRGIGFSAVVLLLVVGRHGRQTASAFRAVGLPGIAVGAGLGTGFVAFVLAMLETTVANAVFVLAAAPLVAAAIGALVLGERPAAATLVASLAALLGVGLTVHSGLAGGAWQGVAWAVVACVGYAGAIVGLRRGRDTDMLPAIALSGLLATGVSAALATGLLELSARDLAISLGLGVFQIGAQYVLITWAARHLAAPRIALLMLLEVVLAPVWVALVHGESPDPLALAGGGLVLAALLFDAVAPARRPAVSPGARPSA